MKQEKIKLQQELQAAQQELAVLRTRGRQLAALYMMASLGESGDERRENIAGQDYTREHMHQRNHR